MTKSAADWEKIEADYRAGIKTLRQIAAEHGISHVAVAAKAKRNRWERDLAERIRLAADAKVNRAVVTTGLTPGNEKEIVEAESEVQARIKLAHRGEIPRKRALINKLFAEVETLTDNKDLAEQMVEALKKGDDRNLAKAARQVITLPGRIKGASELIAALKTVIDLERKIFGIYDTDPRLLNPAVSGKPLDNISTAELLAIITESK